MAKADFSVRGDTRLDASGFNSTLSKMGSVAKKGMGIIVSATAGAVAAIGGIGLNYNAQVEQLQTSFEVMTGSAEEAVGIVENLKKIAAETPFEMTDLAETTQLLMNYGLTAEDAQDKMKMLGDIAQGSAEKMQRIATAYGQMSSAGKVSLEDVKQMIEAGFNPLQEISESTGESMASLYDRISKGTISVDEITASMERSTSVGGKYFQSMEKQSRTLSGQLSTLKDNALSLVGTLTEGVAQALSQDILPQVNGWMEEINQAVETNGIQGMIDAVEKLIPEVVSSITSRLPDLIETGVGIITSIINGIISALPDLIGAVVSGIGSLVQAIADNLPSIVQTVTDVIPEIIQAFVDAAPDLLDAAIDFLESIVEAVPQLITDLSDELPRIVNTITTFLEDHIPEITDAATTMLNGIVDALPGMLSSLTASLPQIINSITSYLSTSLPEITSAATDMFNGIVDAIPGVIDSLVTNLPDIISAIIDFLTTAIPDLLTAAVDMLTAIVLAIPEILPELALKAPQIAWTIIGALVAAIPDLLRAALDLLMQIVFAVPQMISKLKEKLPEIADSIVAELKTLPDKVKKIGQDMGKGLAEGFAELGTWFEEKFNEFKTQFDEKMDSVSAKWNEIWSSIKQFFVDIWNSIVSFFTETIPAWIQSIIDWFNQLPEKIGYAIGQVLAAIVNFGNDCWNWITVELPKIIDGIVNWFKELPGKIKTWLDETIEKIKTWGSDTYDTASQWVQDTVDKVVEWFRGLPGRIKAWLDETIQKIKDWGNGVIEEIKKLPGKVVQIGKDIVSGLWEGITSMGDWLWDKITGFADGIINGFRDGLDINSPSKVMADKIGRWIPPGIVAGVKSALPQALRDLQGMADDMVASAQMSVDQSQSTATGYVPQVIDVSDTGADVDCGDTITIEVPLSVDGREFARATAQYQGTRLAWEG